MAATSQGPPERPTSRKSRRRQRYQLCDPVGAGASGAVYRAFDRELNRTVAVKILRPEIASGFLNLLRLKRELVLASRVSHEHVVRVHDIGEVDGRPLIAMDWVDGETLAQLLQRAHCLSPSLTCTLAMELGEALRSIHAAGIVHRDLKPANLLIRSDGALLVSDFGLARSSLPQDFRLTEPGDASGTPTYMAPERLAGIPADARSDLYAMGLILLEMLTGSTALEALAGVRAHWLSKRVENSIRFQELRKLAALDMVIRRCLLPDRTERYAGADEVLHDLHRADHPAAFPEPTSRRHVIWRRNHAALAAFLVAAFLCSAGWAWLSYHRRGLARLAEADRMYAQTLTLLSHRHGDGNLPTVLESLNAVLGRNPNHLPAARTRLITLIQLFETSRDHQWLSRAQEALGDPSAASLSASERRLIQATLDFHQGHFPSVERGFHSHPSLLGSSKDANLLLGRVAAESGLPQQALLYYRAALRISPESWRGHNDLGYAFLSLGRLQDARREFTRVIELKPDSAVGYSGMGVALLDTGDLTRARQSFEVALEKAPSPETYYNLGVTAYYLRGYATSIPFFESAMRIRPGSDRYMLALADVLRRLHRDDEAREAYSRTLALLAQRGQSGPLSADEQARQAVCFARLGDHASARAVLEAAQNSTPAGTPQLAYACAVMALVDGRLRAAKDCLFEAVRLGYPAALVDIDPDFDDLP